MRFKVVSFGIRNEWDMFKPHDRGNYLYAVKANGLSRLMFDHDRSISSYSFSLISHDHPKIYGDLPFAIVFQFPIEDVLVILKRMAHKIIAFNKTEDSLAMFLSQHRRTNYDNLLYLKSSGDTLPSPRQVIEETISSLGFICYGNSFAFNNELIIRNSRAIVPVKGVFSLDNAIKLSKREDDVINAFMNNLRKFRVPTVLLSSDEKRIERFLSLIYMDFIDTEITGTDEISLVE